MDYLKELYDKMDKIKEQEKQRKENALKDKQTFSQPVYGFQSKTPLILPTNTS